MKIRSWTGDEVEARVGMVDCRQCYHYKNTIQGHHLCLEDTYNEDCTNGNHFKATNAIQIYLHSNPALRDSPEYKEEGK